MNKKNILFLIFTCIPFLVFVGFSTWIIMYEVEIIPEYYANSLTDYFGVTQETTYNGTEQVPLQISGETINSSLISYEYKLETEETYKEGKPIWAGKYDIKITVQDQGSCIVKYIIKKIPIKLKNSILELNYITGIDSSNISKSRMANIIRSIEDDITFVDSSNVALTHYLNSDRVLKEFTKQDLAFSYSSVTNGVDTFLVSDNSSKVPGCTYQMPIVLNEFVSRNYEFTGPNYIIIKYKSVYTNGKYYTIEDAIWNQRDYITLLGDDSNATSYVETKFCQLSSEQGYPYTNYVLETIDGKTYKTFNVSVTMYIPYNSSNTKTEQSTSQSNIVYSALTLSENININLVSGTELYICGKINGTMPNNGLISHKGVIMNNGRITVQNQSKVYCYGHLKGLGDVILKEGSMLMDVMRMFDWPGGTNASSLVSKGFPIIVWNFHAVSCNVYIYKGAEMHGFAVIETKVILGMGGYMPTEFCIVSSKYSNSDSVSCLFMPSSTASSDDYILKKGTSEDNSINKSITESNQELDQKDIIEIHGHYEDKAFAISLSQANFSSSTSKPAPFSSFDIVVSSNSILNLNESSYAFLAGSSLTIEQNATLNIGSGVYLVFDTCTANGDDTYTYGLSQYFSNYCKNNTSAYININGTVAGTGSIGGKVITSSEGAILSSLTKINSITIKNGAAGSAEMINPASDSNPYYAFGDIGTATGYNPNQRFADQSTASFISTTLNGTNYFFTTPDAVKTFKLHFYDPEEDNKHLGTSVLYVVKTDSDGLYSYVITGGELNPYKIHKEIDYWVLLDGSLAKDKILYDGTVYDTDKPNEINLYAVWKDHTYSFLYTSGYLSYKDEVAVDVTANTEFTNVINTFTISDFIDNKLDLTISATYENKMFNGWYIGTKDNFINVEISSITKEDLEKFVEETGSSVIPLYCQFNDGEPYILDFTESETDIEYEFGTKIVYDQVSTIVFPEITENHPNKDITKSKYVVRWYVQKNIGTSENPEWVKEYLEEDTYFVLSKYGSFADSNNVILVTAEFENKTYTVDYKDENGTTRFSHYFLEGVNKHIPLYDGSSDKDKAFDKDPEDGNYRTSYEFNGWSLEKDGDKAYDVGHPLVPTQSIVLYPYYSKKYGLKLELTFSGSVSMNITSDTENKGTHNANKTLLFEVSSLDDTVTVTYSVTNNEDNLTVKHNNQIASANNGIYTIIIDSTRKHTVSITGSCISAGTLLTLWDGSKKPVEQITDDDLLLVFNHETGTYDFANIIFNESDGWKIYKLINLVFSNGQTSKIIYEHGFYDLDLNKYVYIDANNYQNYIGHRFYTAEFINGIYLEEEVILEDAYISEEYTGCYSPVTVYHMNYFTDGILSMPGGISGLFNIFEMNDDLKYDFEQMEEDIEKYGLYTYDDFKDYIPYEVYAAFPAEYFKVSVGKGYITWDGILALIDRYLNLMV